MNTVLSCAVAGAIALGALAGPAGAQAERYDQGTWARTVDSPLSADALGLPESTPARALARAAIARSARRLGLVGSIAGVRKKAAPKVALANPRAIEDRVAGFLRAASSAATEEEKALHGGRARRCPSP